MPCPWSSVRAPGVAFSVPDGVLLGTAVSRRGWLLPKQGPRCLSSVSLRGVNRANPSPVLLLWGLARPSRACGAAGEVLASAAWGRAPQPFSRRGLWPPGVQRTRAAQRGGSRLSRALRPQRELRGGAVCSTRPFQGPHVLPQEPARTLPGVLRGPAESAVRTVMRYTWLPSF